MSNVAMKHASDGGLWENVLRDPQDTGILLAFEGPDGSGKTTQRKLLQSWLQNMQADVLVTKWNSSSVFKPLIKNRKAERSLDPASYAILHAADFWYRHQTDMLPALRKGKIVIADRYVFTGIARDTSRGMDDAWCRKLYTGARKPDLVFYFKANVDVCAARIASSRPIKFYEAGQDITHMDDPYESYLRFAAQVVSAYDRLHEQFRFVVVDAERPVYAQHRFIRETFLNRCRVPAAGLCSASQNQPQHVRECTLQNQAIAQ